MSIIFYQTKKDIDKEFIHTKAIIINMLFLTIVLGIVSYFVYKQIEIPQPQQNDIISILTRDDDAIKNNEIKSYFKLSNLIK